MSGIATAVVVGSVASGYMASRSADKASSRAAEASDEQLAFEYEKYDDWNATYGDIQENLSNYYSNLTPEYYASVGLEAFQQEQQASMLRVEENLAQRGLADSNLAASIEAQAELGAAETRAQIRRDAPQMVRDEQKQFLGMGLGVNPGTSVSSALSQRASTASQYALQSEMAAGQAWGSAINAAGTGITDYVRRPNPVTQGSSMAMNYQVPMANPTVGIA